MNVKFVKLNDRAVTPKYAHIGDAGLDLVATSREIDDDGCVVYGTGIAIEIPEGYVGLVFPRSSNARKNLILSNSVGVIDSTYRGEIMAKFRPIRDFLHTQERSIKSYSVGDRIAQLVILPYPQITLEEVQELSESARGTGGYGSTGI